MLLGYSVLYGGAAALLKLIGFFIFLWVAKILTVEEYAKFGLLYALQQGVAVFSLAGILESAIGLLKKHTVLEQRIQLFAAVIIIFLLMAITVTVLGLSILAIFFGDLENDLFNNISILLSGALISFSMLQAQIVRLEEKHFWSLLFNFFPPLIGITSGFISLHIIKNIYAFFVGYAIGMLVSLFALRVAGIGFWHIYIRLDKVGPIFIGAIPFIITAFFGWLSGYGSNYIINFIFLSHEVARFTFALSLCSIMLLISTALNQVWCPRFYKIIHQIPVEEVERKNKFFYGALSLVLGFVGGIVIAIFPSLIGILGGNLLSYQDMSLELSFLFAGYVILTPWWHCYNYFLSESMGQSVLKITLATSIVGVSVLIALMWIIGPIGIYIGFLVQMLLRSIKIFLVARKIWKINISWRGIFGGIFLIFIGYLISLLN